MPGPGGSPIVIAAPMSVSTDITPLIKAETERQAQAEFHRLSNAAQSVLTYYQGVVAPNHALFVELSKNATEQKSVPGVIAIWRSLRDRFVFSSTSANPALANVAEVNYKVLHPLNLAYIDLDKKFDPEAQLAELEKLNKQVTLLDMYIQNDLNPYSIKKLAPEYKKLWNQFVKDLAIEIEMRREFIKNRDRAAIVDVMLEQTALAGKSDEHGVYRSTRYQEIITPITADEAGRAEQIRKSLDAMNFDAKTKMPHQKADINERPTNPLRYVHAPSHIQSVAVQYDEGGSHRSTVTGKHTETYYENEATRQRHITEISMDPKSIPEDPLARARQIVHMADIFYRNCAKDETGQPIEQLSLNTANAPALFIALTQLGVKASKLVNSEGAPYVGLPAEIITKDRHLRWVNQIAGQLSNQVRQLITRDTSFLNDASFSNIVPQIRRDLSPLRKQVQRQADAFPETSSKLQSLQENTQKAHAELLKLDGVPEYLQELDEASKLIVPDAKSDDDKVDEDDDPGIRLNPI